MNCPLSRFSSTACHLRADGNLDRCHWIPKQRLRDEYRRREYPEQAIEVAIWDRRVWTPGCGSHHDALDARNAIGRLYLEERDYPPELHEYAREYCWFFVSPREGWLVDRSRYETAPAPGLIHDFTPIPPHA